MKSGINFVVLVGALTLGVGGLLKFMHWPAGNGLMIAGLFITVISLVFRKLQNTEQQHD